MKFTENINIDMKYINRLLNPAASAIIEKPYGEVYYMVFKDKKGNEVEKIAVGIKLRDVELYVNGFLGALEIIDRKQLGK